jgi:hypothetical protein
MAAFASAYPLSHTVSAESLARYAGAMKLTDELRFGLAVTSLEARELIYHVDDSGQRYWSMTESGRDWLANNVQALAELRQADKDSEFVYQGGV